MCSFTFSFAVTTRNYFFSSVEATIFNEDVSYILQGRAKVYVVNTRNHSILSKVPNERICSRCGQAYMVDRHGFAVQQQNCIYHWGRKFTIRGEGKYSCCQQYGSATGCCDAKTHVWDYTDYENLRGYVKTLPKGEILS